MSIVVIKARKCVACFPFTFTKYSIVDRFGEYELIIKTGLFNRNEEKIKLYRISDITYKRSFANLLFWVGNIEICASDPSLGKGVNSESVVIIKRIHKYKKFGDKLEELIAEERKKNGVKVTETNLI